MTWLDAKQQDLIWLTEADTNKKVFQHKLYKMLLYQALYDGIKAGTLHFDHSYRYQLLEKYLLDKQHWQTYKQQLLVDAEMTHLTDSKVYIENLKRQLDTLYHQVNTNYRLGLNPELSFDKHQKAIIHTPAIEKPNLHSVNAYFQKVRHLSIVQLLAEVEKAVPFLRYLGHQSKTHEKKRPTMETFFAALLALGCNIGVEKMGNISKGIQATSLKNTTDWYLTQTALQDANDALIKMKNELALPELHRKNLSELHTASDGQKILAKTDSLNASYSYKYMGFSKAVVANTAIDERFALFYSTIVMASDREAINVIDMHLGNPVIKSTLHSTDTHGTTEVVFGMMHLLGVDFAPRIKNIGSQELYSFVNKKIYAQLDYPLLPDHYIDTPLIEAHWDDLLRVMVSLKLGKTSAFQLLKRLNSYAKQNPLQKAMKEVGKITRTAFILRYYDDLALRQSIEKSLNHIELMNRFAKAVFFGNIAAANRQEFQVATKEEQERIILCRRLIQNAIVLWNYLYLSDLLSKANSQQEVEEIIAVVKNGTPVIWQHINLLGEYDFNQLLSNHILQFGIQKLKAWKYAKNE